MSARWVPDQIGLRLALAAVLLLVVTQGLSAALVYHLRPVPETLFETRWVVDRTGSLFSRAVSIPRDERLTWLRAQPEAQWLRFDTVGALLLPPLWIQEDTSLWFAKAIRKAADGKVTTIRTALPPQVDHVPESADQVRVPPHHAPVFQRESISIFIIVAKMPEGDWLTISPIGIDLHLTSMALAGGWLGIALALAAIVAWWVSARIAAPLVALADAADRFGRGLPAAAIPDSGAREIKTISKNFVSMRERIGRYVNDRMTMLAAISHDLRTPMTRMRLRVDRIPDPDLRAALTRDLQALESIAKETLNLAKIEVEPQAGERYDLVSMLQSIADEWTDAGEAVSFSGPRRAIVSGRRDALRRGIENLVENAVRYGGRAEMRLSESDVEYAIDVVDSGPGIPEDQLENVFRPFYRLEGSRNRDTGGTGLGLAIARSLVRAQGGDIVLANVQPGGLVAGVRLPKPKSS